MFILLCCVTKNQGIRCCFVIEYEAFRRLTVRFSFSLYPILTLTLFQFIPWPKYYEPQCIFRSHIKFNVSITRNIFGREFLSPLIKLICVIKRYKLNVNITESILKSFRNISDEIAKRKNAFLQFVRAREVFRSR